MTPRLEQRIDKPKLPQVSLESMRTIVKTELPKDEIAQEASNQLNQLNKQRSDSWKLTPEASKGIGSIVSQLEERKTLLLNSPGLTDVSQYNTAMADKVDLYDAVILRAKSMMPEETMRSLESRISQAKKEKNHQLLTSSLENLALLKQIWDNQLKVLDTKGILNQQEKYKQVKLKTAQTKIEQILLELSQ